MVMLTLAGVGVAYGRRRVLEDVDAEELRGGEVVAVIGANAAGKSSLFRRIAGLAWATGLVELPDAAVEVTPGDPVRFLPYAGFGLRG